MRYFGIPYITYKKEAGIPASDKFFIKKLLHSTRFVVFQEGDITFFGSRKPAGYAIAGAFIPLLGFKMVYSREDKCNHQKIYGNKGVRLLDSRKQQAKRSI